MGGVPVPQTLGPWVTGAFGEQKMLTQLQNTEVSGEAIVVSVGLLPLGIQPVGLDEAIWVTRPDRIPRSHGRVVLQGSMGHRVCLRRWGFRVYFPWMRGFG